MGILTGKVAVVTGGGRGLGRAHALRLAEEGAKVVVNDLGAEPDGRGSDVNVAPAVCNEIEAKGGVAMASTHDVSKRDQVRAMLEAADKRFGGIDILVCSHGALQLGSTILDVEDADWDRLMAINTNGTFYCVQEAAKRMVAQKRAGRIITTSSLVAMTGNPGFIAYSSSKAAIYGLSRSAALELQAHGITVNILTPMAWTRLTAAIPAIAAIANGEQVLSPGFVSDIVAFLASDLAKDITGQVVDIGGPRIGFHHMAQTAPVMPAEQRWTPAELQRRWAEISAPMT